MNPEVISTSYKPIQPAIKQAGHRIAYRELKPHDSLKPFIHCYWQLETKAPLVKPFDYRVAADGCIDIFFDALLPQQSYVMGLSQRFVQFPLSHSFRYIGIRFLPSAFPQICQLSANELTNRTVELELIDKELSSFIALSIPTNVDATTIAQLFNLYFRQRLNKLKLKSDARLYNAMEVIYKKYGTVMASTDLDIGISQRQLRRLFKHYIGASPKIFSKIVRFQNILQFAQLNMKPKQSLLSHAHGFYDQSHLIKDFKQLSGLTPRKITS